MRRILLRISYDGTKYVGWQKQDNGLAVEEVINTALNRLTGEEIAVIGASRTDSGVHALDNVAVFDTESRIPADKFCYALNPYLPGSVIIQNSYEVDPDFHPRHAQCRKTYEYSFYCAAHNNPLLSRYTYFVHTRLDTRAMKTAAEYLVGEHDFAAFCSSGAQVRTTVRTVYSLEIETLEPTQIPVLFHDPSDRTAGPESGSGEPETPSPRSIVRIRITGNGFLYNMVRIIAGTLLQVGMGITEPEKIREILESRDRSLAGPTAPPQGLVLKEIRYMDH